MVVAEASTEVSPKTNIFTKKSLKYDQTKLVSITLENLYMVIFYWFFIRKIYELNILDSKPTPGVYKVTLSATSQDTRIIGNSDATFSIKVVKDIAVENVELAVTDKDQAMTTSNALKLVEIRRYFVVN